MSFDRLAPFYGAIECIAAGGKLQRCRLEFLDKIPVPRRVLLVGEGHGRFLPECAQRFPDAKIIVVDASARMLEIARSKTRSERVSFLHADLLDWQITDKHFDLIVTQFFLDCLTAEALESVVEKLSHAASAHASWLLADFDQADWGPARWRTRAIIAILYRFFRITCDLQTQELAAPDGPMRNAGFHRKARQTFEWGLLKSEWWVRG